MIDYNVMRMQRVRLSFDDRSVSLMILMKYHGDPGFHWKFLIFMMTHGGDTW